MTKKKTPTRANKPTFAEIDALIQENERTLWSDCDEAQRLAENGIEIARSAKYPEAAAHFAVLRAESLREIDLAASRSAYEEIRKTAKKSGYWKLEGRAVLGLAYIAHSLSEPQEIILRQLEAGRRIGEQHSDLMLQASALQGLADVRYRLGDYVGAADAAKEAYVKFEEAGEDSEARLQLVSLATILHNVGRMDEALELCQKAQSRDKSEATPPTAESDESPSTNTHTLLFILRLKGNIHFRRNHYEESLKSFQEVLELASSKGFAIAVEAARTNIAGVLGRLGRYEEAIEEFARAKHSQSRRNVMSAYVFTASSLIELGRFDEAERELAVFDREMRMTAPAMIVVDYYKTLSKFYRAKGDYEHALLAKDEADKLISTMDASPDAQSRVSSTYLLIQMERDKHVREIETLRVQQMERDLSNTTLQLLAQTELLSDLREDLLQMARRISTSEPDSLARSAMELRNRVKNLPCKSVDWAKFDMQFKAAHPEFTKKLLDLYPTLSPQELRICSLLRMNLNSEEIARLLCLSARTVEGHRFQIRKKMKLKKSNQDLMLHLAKL